MTIKHDLAQRMHKQLVNVENFKDTFKIMMAALSLDEVYSWDSDGCPHEPTPVDVRRMLALELKGLHVYAILDNTTVIGAEKVHMMSYLFVSDDEEEDQQYEVSVCDPNGVYYAIADVYNESWNINEMGSVLIETSGIGPRRCG